MSNTKLKRVAFWYFSFASCCCYRARRSTSRPSSTWSRRRWRFWHSSRPRRCSWRCRGPSSSCKIQKEGLLNFYLDIWSIRKRDLNLKEGEFVSGVRDSAAFRDLNTLGVKNNIEEDENQRQVTFWAFIYPIQSVSWTEVQSSVRFHKDWITTSSA